jgi:hypothetical protein
MVDLLRLARFGLRQRPVLPVLPAAGVGLESLLLFVGGSIRTYGVRVRILRTRSTYGEKYSEHKEENARSAGEVPVARSVAHLNTLEPSEVCKTTHAMHAHAGACWFSKLFWLPEQNNHSFFHSFILSLFQPD